MKRVTNILFNDVTPERMARLLEKFKAQGGAIGSPTSGLAENVCFAGNYQYDQSRQSLVVEPVRMVPNLTLNGLRRTIQHLLWPPPKSRIMTDGEVKPTPSPFVCAVYNWSFGYIKNNTNDTLTYSDKKTDHGNSTVFVTKVEPGDTFDTYYVDEDDMPGYWQNEAGKDSTKGCQGSVVYLFADGQTTLTVNYKVNTKSSTAADAAISGINASRYKATVDADYDHDNTATFQYVYVTVDLA